MLLLEKRMLTLQLAKVDQPIVKSVGYRVMNRPLRGILFVASEGGEPKQGGRATDEGPS